MKLYNLQVLRGFAALLVCCFHMKNWLDFDAHKWGENIFGHGSIGVPVFFVISGFIMVYTTQKLNLTSPGKASVDFLAKRFVRIVPLYFLLTFAWMVLGHNFMLYFKPEYWPRLWHSLLFLPYKTEPVLFLGWSLNFEMFFYIVFALSFFLVKNRYIAVILFFLAAIIFGMFLPCTGAYCAMVTNPINIHFLVGILIGLFYKKITWNSYGAQIFSASGIAVFSAFLLHLFEVNDQFISALLVGWFVYSFILADQYRFIKPGRFLIMLGDISFSLYLIHPFVQIRFRKYFTGNPENAILLFLAQLSIIIMISKICYELVEKRVTNFLKIKFSIK